MSITLYERVGKQDDHRPSPFSWRIKFALAHKGLKPDENVPVLFTDKDIIAFSGQGFVPVLVDGDQVVSDSWTIARYLEDAYPDRPSLFGGPQGRALAGFVNRWADGVLNAAVFPLVIKDLHANIDPRDQDYFQQTREKRLGRTIEQFDAERPSFEANLAKVLMPLRQHLEDQAFVSGAAPAYGDYIVFSAFQWARCSSPTPLLAPDDSLHPWLNAMSGLYDGLACSLLRFETGQPG